MSIPPTRNTYSEVVRSSDNPLHSRIISTVNDRHHKQNRHNNITMITSQTPQFEGECEDLKGQIYDCADIRQGNQYSRTTKEISEYVGRTFKSGMDTKLSIEKLQLVVIPMPSNPPLESTRINIRIWEKRIDDYVKRETSCKENIKTTYSLIWGQCSIVMRQKVESFESFKAFQKMETPLRC
jgi:hypothetical protein